MKRELLKDVLIVFAVWFVAAYLWSGFPLSLAPTVLVGVGLVWAVGWTAGIGSALAAKRFTVSSIQKKVAGVTADDPRASASIMEKGSAPDAQPTFYRVALPVTSEPERAAGGDNPLHSKPWWPAYALRHAGYAAVIDDVFGIMQTRPGMPAGIDKHAGVTLVDHSASTVDKILELAPGWIFKGIFNSHGKLVGDLLDKDAGPACLGAGTSAGSPILPVAAFAHDIGKVECLVSRGKAAGRDTGGFDWRAVVARVARLLGVSLGSGLAASGLAASAGYVMRDGHGRKGAELLRRLHSVQALPDDDRKALLIAVHYYHGCTQIPPSKWVGDKPRALAVLLHDADSEASYGAKEPAVAQPAPAVDTGAAALAAVPDVATPVVATAPAAASDKETRDVVEPLVEALSEYGAVNGQARSQRLAWKHGDWVFVLLEPCARCLTAKLDVPSPALGGESTSPVVAALLEQLDEAGLLYRGSPQRDPVAAIWNVTSDTRGGVAEARMYKAIIVSKRMAQYVEAIKDCDHRPTIVDKDGGPLTVPPDDGVRTAVVDAGAAEVRGGKGLPRRQVAADALVELALAGEPVYGLLTRQVGEHTYAAFDAEELRDAFEFDEGHLPKGVYLKHGKDDGRAKLVVTIK